MPIIRCCNLQNKHILPKSINICPKNIIWSLKNILFYKKKHTQISTNKFICSWITKAIGNIN